MFEMLPESKAVQNTVTANPIENGQTEGILDKPLDPSIAGEIEQFICLNPKGLVTPRRIIDAALESHPIQTKPMEIIRFDRSVYRYCTNAGLPIPEDGIDATLQRAIFETRVKSFVSMQNFGAALPKNNHSCYSLVFTFIRYAHELGLDIKQFRTFNNGGHIGLIYRLDKLPVEESFRIYDPFPDVTGFVDIVPPEMVTSTDLFETIWEDPQAASREKLQPGNWTQPLGHRQMRIYNPTAPLTFNYLYQGLMAEAAFLRGHYYYDALIGGRQSFENALTFLKTAQSFDPHNRRTNILIRRCTEKIEEDKYH